MKWERRAPLAWLAFGAVIACAWCSFLSGLGGWVMGQDLARRETSAEFATTSALKQNLPPLGVLVTRLDRSGPAARAGVQRGDAIVAINGVKVQDARDLREQLQGYHVGDTVLLTVQHDTSEENVPVNLDSFPGENRQPYLGVYFTARGDDPADL